MKEGCLDEESCGWRFITTRVLFCQSGVVVFARLFEGFDFFDGNFLLNAKETLSLQIPSTLLHPPDADRLRPHGADRLAVAAADAMECGHFGYF
jgi:hypothetical protein